MMLWCKAVGFLRTNVWYYNALKVPCIKKSVIFFIFLFDFGQSCLTFLYKIELYVSGI